MAEAIRPYCAHRRNSFGRHFSKPDTIVSIATHDLEWHSFFTAKSVYGIVHIINHTVHIWWEDVMIFANKRDTLLGFLGFLVKR